MPTVLRRLLLWTVICSVSAAPSFFIASGQFNRTAMVVGVCLFIAAYTICTSTKEFARFHRRPFVRRTLYIGYGFRLILSLMFPLGFGTPSTPEPLLFVAWADMWPGMLSLHIAQAMGVRAEESFAGTLATTIVQGTLLNIIIFLLMLVVYWFQQLFMTPPPEQAARGFEVVLPLTPGPKSP